MKTNQNANAVPIEYVRLSKWCECTGIPKGSIYNAITDRKLLRGKHYIKTGDSKNAPVLLNIREMNQWLKNQAT